jgi:hypothetical protein
MTKKILAEVEKALREANQAALEWRSGSYFQGAMTLACALATLKIVKKMLQDEIPCEYCERTGQRCWCKKSDEPNSG